MHKTGTIDREIYTRDKKFGVVYEMVKFFQYPLRDKLKIFRSKPVVILDLFKAFGLLVDDMKILIESENFFGCFADVENQRYSLSAQGPGDFRSIAKDLKYDASEDLKKRTS